MRNQVFGKNLVSYFRIPQSSIVEQLMSQEHSVLVVDSDVAFSTMLREGLEQNGGYSVTTASSGAETWQALASREFDLAIVDLGVEDPDGATLARALRQQKPTLRLMLIPLMGEEVPPELGDLPVQGILPKPFFLPELPGRIADALAQPIAGGQAVAQTAAAKPSTAAAKPSTAAAEPVAPSGRLSVPPKRLPQVTQAMTRLFQEINAEAVILTCGGDLIAHTGRLPAEESANLAQVVGESWRTSVRVARILGREQLRFEQSVEGGEHMFYSLAVAEDIILSVALRVSVPLGMIRHRTKATAETLRSLITATE
jgi:CheY-like chemotaxis protein